MHWRIPTFRSHDPALDTSRNRNDFSAQSAAYKVSLSTPEPRAPHFPVAGPHQILYDGMCLRLMLTVTHTWVVAT